MNGIVNTYRNPQLIQAIRLLQAIQGLTPPILNLPQAILFAYAEPDMIRQIISQFQFLPRNPNQYQNFLREAQALFNRTIYPIAPTLAKTIHHIIQTKLANRTQPIHDIIQAQLPQPLQKELTPLMTELFPFLDNNLFYQELLNQIDQSIQNMLGAPNQTLTQDITFQILATLNYIFLTIHFALLIDYRMNMPHETTFKLVPIPAWNHKTYDGTTQSTNITYTPIILEPNSTPYTERFQNIQTQPQTSVMERYQQLIIPIPIGEGSNQTVPILSLGRPALIMTLAYLQLQHHELQKEHATDTASHAVDHLVQHQIRMIQDALTQPDPEHAPVWLYVRQEPGLLSAKIHQQDIHYIHIGPLKIKIPISIMPRLRETLRKTKLLELFMNITPVNIPRSTPVRLAKLISLIGRTTKTSMDLFGGQLVTFAQNHLTNALSQTSWKAFLSGFLFGWAPYKASGLLYKLFQQKGQTQRSLDTISLYTLLQLQFDAIRDPQSSTQPEEAFFNPRETEHIPLVFSTTHPKFQTLYHDIYQHIQSITPHPLPDSEYHHLTEMFIIRTMLDDNLWSEEPDIFHQHIYNKLNEIAYLAELYQYLDYDKHNALEYLNRITENQIDIPTEPLRFIPTPGESHLFKIHNRFYTHLMRLHNFPIREPMSAMLLMEHLLMNTTIANFLQRAGIGTGIMRPEGMLTSAIIPTLSARGIHLDENESRIAYRGMLQHRLRKLYDAYRQLHYTLTSLNLLYQELHPTARSLNTILTFGLGTLYLAGYFNPFTLPLFLISSFFTLSNFLKKIYWVNTMGFELQRDLKTYHDALYPNAQITLLSNPNDTNKLIQSFINSIETLRITEQLIQQNQPVPPENWLLPETFATSPGSTRFILQPPKEQNIPQYEIIFSEPHSIALLSLILRPDMLTTFIEQLRTIQNQLPSVQELQNYIQLYRQHVQPNRIYEIIQIENRYFLRVTHPNQNRYYYELGWFKENIKDLIQHYERILNDYEKVFNTDYHQQLLASEFILRTLLERRYHALQLPPTPNPPRFFQLIQDDMNQLLNQIFQDLGLPLPEPPETADEKLKQLLERLMLYSARVETALNEIAYLPLEKTDVDIRSIPELEAILKDPETQELIEEVKQIVEEYNKQVLDPIRTDMLTTFLIHVNYRNTLYETIRDTLIHIALAPNVIMSQLLAVPSIFRNIARALRATITKPTQWTEQLIWSGANQALMIRLALTGFMLLMTLLTPALYCRIPLYQTIWDKLRLNYLIEFDCRSGRFGSISIGYKDHKITFRPAYVLDLATRILYDLMNLFKPTTRDPEERKRELVNLILFRPAQTFYDWLAIRIPPLESTTIGTMELFLNPTEIQIIQRIHQDEPNLFVHDRSIDDYIQLILNNFMPMGIENARETMARLLGANSRSPLWTWLTNDEALMLTPHTNLTESPGIWGYPAGLPDWNKFWTALPAIGQSFSLRTVRPYNPLNQIQNDPPQLYQLGIRTPRGTIESTTLQEDQTITQLTNTYRTRTERNRDYNLILNGITPTLYTILEQAPFEEMTIQEWLRTTSPHYSPFIPPSEPLQIIRNKYQNKFLSQPVRIIRAAMMLYEYAEKQTRNQKLLKPLPEFLKWSQTQAQAHPATLNGIIYLGAQYALHFHQQPPKINKITNRTGTALTPHLTLMNAINFYHLYATTELYRILATTINPEETTKIIKEVVKKHNNNSIHDVYNEIMTKLRNMVVQYVNENARTREEKYAFYQFLLHRALTHTSYENSYSPSYHIGYLFGLGLFFKSQKEAIEQAQQNKEVSTLVNRFLFPGRKRE